MITRQWLLEQIADVESVIATLERNRMDATSYRRLLIRLWSLLREMGHSHETL